LAKGSTHYSNISIGGVWNRVFIKQSGLPGPLMSLEELPSKLSARGLTLATAVPLIALVAVVIGRRPLREESQTSVPEQAYVLEYHLAVAIGILVSSVSWEFYVIWLLPLFLAVFLAPARVLPADRGLRWVLIAAFAVAYLGMNYPGGRIGREYFFDVNSVFYHPDWMLGSWVEEHVFHLYGAHLTVAPVWRLASLSFLSLALVAAIFEIRQKRDHPPMNPQELL
jgi:hypothetical protein